MLMYLLGLFPRDIEGYARDQVSTQDLNISISHIASTVTWWCRIAFKGFPEPLFPPVCVHTPTPQVRVVGLASEEAGAEWAVGSPPPGVVHSNAQRDPLCRNDGLPPNILHTGPNMTKDMVDSLSGSSPRHHQDTGTPGPEGGVRPESERGSGHDGVWNGPWSRGNHPHSSAGPGWPPMDKASVYKCLGPPFPPCVPHISSVAVAG
ncbi:hypothetical protein VTK56DRAFT_1364 [Thermocarpiscus australiensis]